MTLSGAGAAGLLPGGSRRVWGVWKGALSWKAAGNRGRGEQGEAASGAAQAVSPRVPSLCPLVSPHHLPISSPLVSPHVPSPPLVFPHQLPVFPITSPHVPSCPPVISPHAPSIISPRFPSLSLLIVSSLVPSSSPRVISSRHLSLSPLASLHHVPSCLLVYPHHLPHLPFHLPCCPLLSPGRRAGLHPTPASPRPQRGRGSVTHFPPGPASLPPWPRAGDASREPQHSSGTWGRVARPQHPSVLASGCCPRGGKGRSWVSACRAPDPAGVTVSPCPARGAAGGDHGSGGSILLHGSIPVGGRLRRGRCPGCTGHTEPPGVESGLGFVAEGRVPVVSRSERGRGPAGPAVGSGRCRSGRLSLQIPPVRCCRRWRKSFGREMMTG